MIRNLNYPGDARKTIDSLKRGLAYDAAIAIAGNRLQELSEENGNSWNISGIRYGELSVEQAVWREAPGLFSRFSIISMVSRLDSHAQNLLLQRKVLEELKSPKTQIFRDKMWQLMQETQKDARKGPVKLFSESIIKQPSQKLQDQMSWLSGIYRIRNCLAHRSGKVQIIDVKPYGKPFKETSENDLLRVKWLKMIVVDNNEAIKSFPHTSAGGQIGIKFEEYERTWKVGDQIEVTPNECQAIAMSLSILGNTILNDFEREMNIFLGLAENK